MPAPSLQIQTVYAELLERAAATAFDEAFPRGGNFVRKTLKGRSYWYFQATISGGRVQRYVGPETPELLKEISRHRDARDDIRERRTLVSTLVRSFGIPAPLTEIGDAIQALAGAGVFRLQSVLVGTVAFQTYPAMLGTRLNGAAFRTDDVDIAQFREVSVAVEDKTPPIQEVLKGVDETFRSIPHMNDGRKATRYQAKNGLRVDFLTPNRGADTSAPQRLPALRTDAEPLRFLDFLIRDPQHAVVLHGAGIFVLVPAPERFAIHKLIVSRRRVSGSPKREKDLHQAEALIIALAEKRPFELAEMWNEAYSRGATWRQLLLEALSLAASEPRDLLLKLSDQPRSIIPKLDLLFAEPVGRYDFDRDTVFFDAKDTSGSRIVCSISREALEDHFGADGLDRNGRLEIFRRNRSAIEAMTRRKYLAWPIEDVGSVLLKTNDIPRLTKSR
jgi:hypothetical protein